MSPRAPTGIDAFIVKKIRDARGTMTQLQLAKKMGIAYQQLQKYETAKNRVAASRLLQIACVTGKPIGYFFPRGKE